MLGRRLPRRATWSRRWLVGPRMPNGAASERAPRAAEDCAAVELVCVCPVAAFHPFVAFRAALRDLLVRDVEILQVSCEVSAELGAMISPNPLDGDGKPAANLLDEISGRLD